MNQIRKEIRDLDLAIGVMLKGKRELERVLCNYRKNRRRLVKRLAALGEKYP